MIGKDGYIRAITHAPYAGLLASVLGIIVYRASYFMLYDSFRDFVMGRSQAITMSFGFAVTLLAG